MRYYVIESRKTGGTTVVYSSTDEMEAARYEDELRKSYADRTVVDCYIKTDEEIERTAKAVEKYNALTEEQKKEFVFINGRKYIKALCEEEK